MYKIIRKKELNPTVTQMEILAPLVANKAKPGQFIILRVTENGERIPPTETLMRLADFYNVSMDYIMCRTEKTEINK
mgnify:CR=1 FL=1